jgi:nicotinamidase-related amidase
MADEEMLSLCMRRQRLALDDQGRNVWEVIEERCRVPAARTALLLCDVWDQHWSRGANERLAELLPRMAEVVEVARARGVQIVHAPSETMAYYAGSPARQRMVEAAERWLSANALPEPRVHDEPPLPVDASDGGSDTNEPTWHRAWARQHPAIAIDEARDVISDDGAEVYAWLQVQAIQQVLIMGVHANMCILRRPFAIMAMVRWGVEIALVRDLTDAMYNPARPPYVSHDEGTNLVIGYIEKHWCPTVASEDLVTTT